MPAEKVYTCLLLFSAAKAGMKNQAKPLTLLD
jgi:hypothetical protein